MMLDAINATRALNGIWRGNYGLCRCPAHDDRTPSMQIMQYGDRPFFKCYAGCEWDAIKDALISLGILPRDGDKRPARTEPPAKLIKQPCKDKSNMDAALKIWRASIPIAGTLAEAYLNRRSIQLARLPASLRFHGNLRHITGGYYPALIAGFAEYPRRNITAIQRIFLAADGSKAKIEPGKMSLGSMTGAAIRLCRLNSDDELILCEGLEDALSIYEATKKPVWAVGGASNLKAVALPAPADIRGVIVAADNDQAGQQAAEQAAIKFKREGYNSRIAAPPKNYKDYNAWLNCIKSQAHNQSSNIYPSSNRMQHLQELTHE